MKQRLLFLLTTILIAITTISFRDTSSSEEYRDAYNQSLARLSTALAALRQTILNADVDDSTGVAAIRTEIGRARYALKATDFWIRYFEPTTYKKVNGPLPVEWETEVFEKFEQPYQRHGAGLTLAWQYLEEATIYKDTLLRFVSSAQEALPVFQADSMTGNLASYHHFYLCNRLFLLNLAAIYTTGFECPDTTQVIPELRAMLGAVRLIYQSFNASFPASALPAAYTRLYEQTIDFCAHQPSNYSGFDHFTFLRSYVNPLYSMNQQLISEYKVVSRSMVDYSLSKTSSSIFEKDVYHGQNAKGIFLRVKDTAVLAEIDKIGKLLFYDPILSGNNSRSCASCHKPAQFFTDTVAITHFQYNHQDLLARNTPSLINAGYNHLVMADGQHFTLQNQTKAVITNPTEMGSTEAEVLKKVLSCNSYKAVFTRLLAFTPQEPEITFDHIASAITYYYGKFSKAAAPFDHAMNKMVEMEPNAQRGFNLFMSKAQCGTCHFVPQFNGVKPPFVGSEFEVLGVPANKTFTQLSNDKGRYKINPAPETMNAFRTGSLRNAKYTAPYMHNGVFKTLDEVLDFYNAGGGVGHGLDVPNQTLSTDSLHLTSMDKRYIVAFIESLNERIPFEQPPLKLPSSSIKSLNRRKVGGVY